MRVPAAPGDAGALLLVDDDEAFGDILARTLTRRGFDVTVARSVEDARRAAGEGRFDYALIDLRVGADTGLALVEEFGRAPDPPHMVILTGYGSIATAVKAIKLGADQYLTKPATTADILAALDGRPPAAAGPEAEARPLSVRRLEWEHIQKVLAEHGGNISATARALGMHRRTLQRKLQKRPVRS